MEYKEIQSRIADLEQQISALPIGSITRKVIGGKEYFYHRWTENKKRREKFIPVKDVDLFRTQIAERKSLEEELKKLQKQLLRISVSAKSFFLSRQLSDITRNETVSVCCRNIFIVRRRIKCLFSTACVAREKRP